MVILMDFHWQLLHVRVDYKMVPMAQSAAHAKSSTLYSRLYGRTVAHPNFFSLIGYFYLVL